MIQQKIIIIMDQITQGITNRTLFIAVQFQIATIKRRLLASSQINQELWKNR